MLLVAAFLVPPYIPYTIPSEQEDMTIPYNFLNKHVQQNDLNRIDRGVQAMHRLYKQAIDEDYRFLSYGDCCLLTKYSVTDVE